MWQRLFFVSNSNIFLVNFVSFIIAESLRKDFIKNILRFSVEKIQALNLADFFTGNVGFILAIRK